MFKQTFTTSLVLAGLTSIASAQDLRVSNLTSSHGSAILIPGMQTRVTVDTQNYAGLMNRSTASTESGFYISKDSSITNRDILVRAFTTRALAPYQKVRTYATLTMPKNIPAQDCYLGVFVDHYNRVRELSESNNTTKIRVRCGNQDLAANVITDATAISKGTRVSVTSSIFNRGNIPSYATKSGHYLSSNTTISRADTLLGSFDTKALGASRAWTYTKSYVMGATNHLPALCYFGVIADHENRLGEADESNNSAVSRAVRVDGEPDVAIVGFTSTDTKPIRGTKIQVKVSFENRGRQNTKAGTVRYWLKSVTGNPYTTRDWRLGSFSVPILYAKGRTRTLTHELTIPAEICAERTWYLRALYSDRSREIRIVPQWPTQPGYYIGQTTREITTHTDFNVCSKRVGTLQPNTHYMFVVGASGTSPGIDFGALGILHLQLDAYSTIGFGIHGTVFRNMLGRQYSSNAQGSMKGGSWVRNWPTRAWFAAVYFDGNGLLGFSQAPSLQMNLRR